MKITQVMLDKLTEEMKASERQRMNLNLRDSVEEGSQRMMNTIEPRSNLAYPQASENFGNDGVPEEESLAGVL